MSKIGKLPIAIQNGVTVTVQQNEVQVAGPKGNVSYTLPEGVNVEVAENVLSVKVADLADRKLKAMFGLTRANLANIVKGVGTGFEKKLEMTGVGYRAQMQGTDLVLSLGFSHPVKITPQAGITLSVGDNNSILVSGSDKILVGQTAALIRKVRPPEPYKGKGIRYQGERIRRKAGKAAKAGSK